MTLPRKRNVFALLISGLIIALYFFLWNRYAINIPKWDDHALKNFILAYEKAPTFSAKIDSLFKQHNEHRIVLTRLVTLIDYKLFSVIDFRHLMIFGNLALLLIWWLITRFFKNTIASFWYAIPIVTLWFSLAFWENAFWGMAAVQNFWVVALALLSFWIIRRNDNTWFWAIPVAFIAFFTSGNGILVLPVCFLILTLEKQYKKSAYWAFFSIAVVMLYFYYFDYTRPPKEFVTPSNVKLIFRGFMLISGSIVEGLPFGNMPTQMPLWNGWLTSFVSFCLILYIIRNYFKKHSELNHYDYFYLSGTLFALLSIALVCYSRLGQGTDVMLNSRYKVYSALLFSFNLAYLIIFVNQKFRDALTITFLVGSLFLYACNQHYHLYDAINFRKFQVSAAYNWGDYPDPNVKGGFLYKKPILFTNKLQIPPIKDASYKNFNSKLEWSEPNFVSNDFRDGGLYLLLSGKESSLVPFIQPRKHSFRNLLNYDHYFGVGASVKLNPNEFNEGIYNVFIIDNSADNLKITSDSQVNIQHSKSEKIKVNW